LRGNPLLSGPDRIYRALLTKWGAKVGGGDGARQPILGRGATSRPKGPFQGPKNPALIDWGGQWELAEVWVQGLGLFFFFLPFLAGTSTTAFYSMRLYHRRKALDDGGTGAPTAARLNGGGLLGIFGLLRLVVFLIFHFFTDQVSKGGGDFLGERVGLLDALNENCQMGGEGTFFLVSSEVQGLATQSVTRDQAGGA